MRYEPHHSKKKRGQALTELAVIVPVLMMCLCGVIEFGRLFFSWVTVQHAARVGARAAITGQGEQDGTRYDRIIAAARQATSSLPGTAPIISLQSWAGVTATGPGRSNNPGAPCELVEVDVQYTYKPVVPLIKHFMPNNGQITFFGKDRKLNEPWIPCP